MNGAISIRVGGFDERRFEFAKSGRKQTYILDYYTEVFVLQRNIEPREKGIADI